MTISFISSFDHYHGPGDNYVLQPVRIGSLMQIDGDSAVIHEDFKLSVDRLVNGKWQLSYTPTGGKTLELIFDQRPAFAMMGAPK